MVPHKKLYRRTGLRQRYSWKTFIPLVWKAFQLYPSIYLSTEAERYKHFNIKKVLKLISKEEKKSLGKPLHDMGQFIKSGEPMRSIKHQMLSQNSSHSPWEDWGAGGPPWHPALSPRLANNFPHTWSMFSLCSEVKIPQSDCSILWDSSMTPSTIFQNYTSSHVSWGGERTPGHHLFSA